MDTFCPSWLETVPCVETTLERQDLVEPTLRRWKNSSLFGVVQCRKILRSEHPGKAITCLSTDPRSRQR